MAQVGKKLTQTTLFGKKKGKGPFSATNLDTDYFRVIEVSWKTAEETNRQKFLE